MKINAKTSIGNRFDIECRDIRTGEVQKFQAHNIVLDQMWNRLVNFQTYFSYIRFGTGTGALNPARTSLFNDSGGKSATTVTRKRALPTSSWMQQIVINPEEYVGHELTEVGVAYGSGSTDLVTHAFLEDSEGNPISIVKTDTMVVTIYATIFIELGELEDMYGGKFRWVMPAYNNELINYLTGYASYPTQRFRVTGARDFHNGVADYSHGQSAGILVADWIKDAANKRVTTPKMRLGINTGNGAIRGIGLGSADDKGTFRGQFPIAGVFTGHSIEGETVGIGDGEAKDFSLAWNGATANSVTVKVDDVTASPTINELINYAGTMLSVPALAGRGNGCAFSPDGTLLAVAHINSPFLAVIRTSDWTKVTTPSLPNTGYGCAFSPNGQYLAVAHDGSPYITVYSVSGGVLTKISNPANLPTGTGYGCAFSPDGQYLAVAHYSSPYITVYSVSGGVLTKLDDPATLLTSQGQSCAFSPDSTLLAVTHYTSPYVTVYSIDSGVLTKLDSPATLPTGQGNGCAFSPDGTLLAVAHNTSPYITVYSIDSGVLTKISNPANLPTGTGTGCAFSPDGSLLAVTHYTSPYVTVYSIDSGVLTKLDSPATLPTGTGYGCAFSPDGQYLAVAHYSSPYLTVLDGAYNTGATHNIVFATPPAEGSIITADYTVPYIPKDTDHVLDLQVAIQYGEGV